MQPSPSRRRTVLGTGSPFVLTAILALGAGCHTYQHPKYEVKDQKILLVPFRDMKLAYRTAPGESPRGQKVVDAFRSWTEKEWSPQIVEGNEVLTVVRTLREWPTEKKQTSKDWKKILAGIDADLVLTGEILDIRDHDPKTIGIYKGTIRGRYSVIDAHSGKTAYASPEFSCEWPKDTELDPPIADLGNKPDDIERNLLREFGERIGKDLYGYYSEK